ncbi:hypothetical protein P5673_014229 [Acropora cervicornis]|uniref:Uncharacterized protein n=1 Tax=Acropora cervicornis TaxID=6130 RepID=A0AAD9V6I4_ACRCE|nr:hypothetical protein P5673_014229 [Acropora cervicornis]
MAIVRSEIPVMRESCLFETSIDQSHSRLHFTFICKSCGSDYRQCECETVNRQSRPNKRQRNAEAQEIGNNKELQKRYDSLLKDHERLAQAFRNQEKETQLLGQQLEEKEKEYEEEANDAEELANLVRTKCEAIKTLEKRLVDAKKLIASLKQELQSARNISSVTEPQHPDPPQQQSTRVSSHSLSSIHSRYDKVLQTMKDNNCSMANAYRLSGCPRSTLRDFIAIAELKKVDSRGFEIALANYQGESVRELEKMCRKSLGRYMPLMSTMRREGQLLKFFAS